MQYEDDDTSINQNDLIEASSSSSCIHWTYRLLKRNNDHICQPVGSNILKTVKPKNN